MPVLSFSCFACQEAGYLTNSNIDKKFLYTFIEAWLNLDPFWMSLELTENSIQAVQWIMYISREILEFIHKG